MMSAIFYQDYITTFPLTPQNEEALTTLYKAVTAHLTFHAAIRSYRANELTTAWRYLYQSLRSDPTSEKAKLTIRLVVKSLLGKTVFNSFKSVVRQLK